LGDFHFGAVCGNESDNSEHEFVIESEEVVAGSAVVMGVKVVFFYAKRDRMFCDTNQCHYVFLVTIISTLLCWSLQTFFMCMHQS
jgi:hypothetical protein